MATDTKILVINEVEPPDYDPPRTFARNTGNSVETSRTCIQENERNEFHYDPTRTYARNTGDSGLTIQKDENSELDTYRRADPYEQRKLSSDERNTPDFKIIHGYQLDLEAGAKYDKYIIIAAIVTIFCCWPIGICAIINAFQARRAARLRDEEGTARYTSWATTQIISAVFAGFLVLMIVILFVVVRIQTMAL